MVYLPLGPDWTPLEAESEDAELLTVLVRYGFWWLICLGGSKKTKGWMGVWLVFFLVDYFMDVWFANVGGWTIWVVFFPVLRVSSHLMRLGLLGFIATTPEKKFHKLNLECSRSLFFECYVIFILFCFQDKLQGSVLRSHNHGQGLAIVHGQARHTKTKKGVPILWSQRGLVT